MLTTTYDLSLQPGVVSLTVPVSQYDVGSRQLVFNLYTDEGTFAMPSGVQAEIRGTKPDGNGFSYSASVSGSSVTVTITQQMTAVSGKTRCELVLYKGTYGSSGYYQLATANFILLVERAALDKDTPKSNSEIRELINVIDRADEIIAAGEQSDSAATRIAALEQSARSAASEASQALSDITDISTTLMPTARAAKQYIDIQLEDAIAEMTLERQNDLLAINFSFTRKLQELNETHAQNMEELRSAHNTDIAAWRAEYANYTDDIRTAIEDALAGLSRVYNEKSQTMNEQHASNMNEMQDAYSDDIAALQQRYQDYMGNLQDAISTAIANIESHRDSIINTVDASVDEKMEALLVKFAEIIAVKTVADNTAAAAVEISQSAAENAAQALEKASVAENSMSDTIAAVEKLKSDTQLMSLVMSNLVGNGYVEDGVAIFTNSKGQPLFEITGIGGGGGGGGGDDTTSSMTMSNTSGWNAKTLAIADDTVCPVSFKWSSIKDEMPTGNGRLTIHVNDSLKATFEVEQGDRTVDIAPYLSAGSNAVTLTVMDIYGKKRFFIVTVSMENLKITSQFDANTPYKGVILFSYIPTGAVEKTIYFILDDEVIGTTTTSASNRQQSFSIPQQSHGAHTLRCYFEAEINGQVVRSNELYYEIICIDPLNNAPIITSPFNKSTAIQYATLNIPFTVYTPSSLTSEVTITVNGTLVSSQTVDRTEQTFAYRANDIGTLNVVIASSSAQPKTLTVEITESSIQVEAETQNLSLYLNARGRSNNEANPGTWQDSDNGISATMTDFNFKSDGWQLDENGVTVLRVSGDARVTIPSQLFATDFRSTGKTIEVEFATRDVMDYDAIILSCMSGGRGLSMTAQRATLSSEQSQVSMQYKENENVRISFVVEKRTEYRLLYIYVNGVMSGVTQYPDSDDFSQVSPVGISIGSNDCTVDIYCIRVYDNNLTRHQILENWIADTQNVDDLIERYNRNNIYDAYGNVVIANLPGSLPYMIIGNCPELPQYKGDKKTCDVTYIDPITPSKSFTATNVQIDVQGTSSQYYARKNYKMKYKNGFVLSNGTSASKYAMRTDSIPVNTFCMKKDVASSEGANNVELARLYNDICPYKTPAQVKNSRVRQGIDGFPMVIFYDNGSTSFLGKYNFNNDKSTEDVFGFATGDESWEVLNNTSLRVLFKSADYTGTDWLNDFEARYPDLDDPYVDNTQLAAFAAFVAGTDVTAATGNALAQSYTDVDGNIHTVDDAAYRLAKFKTEAWEYIEKDSAIFFYLFTELFLMVDNRAKNMFISFMGSAVS